ncbi:MAG: quinone-dependent dihydroorotate dehydrogenase [Verrucomicrobiota bacterium]|nr:quinone-dependent dihydroorotate dehydrogenase [Verrucomicrobiota bacterium]
MLDAAVARHDNSPVSWLYKTFVRPNFFDRDSEEAHNLVLNQLSWAAQRRWALGLARRFLCGPSLPVKLFGLTFPNPIGLAAGMDKAGAAVPAWEALGFGFNELGGVTRYGQPGNPKPRMFRVIEDEALINRMGFNNPGADAMAERLLDWRDDSRWPAHPVGINLGKSKVTPLDKAPEDYLYSFQLLKGLADFFVVNVSSPNTPNLRQLQDKDALAEILSALQEANDTQRPILVKVAPDLGFDALDEILELIEPHQIAGLVATNTTIERPSENGLYAETGGLSGRPLATRSTEVIRYLYQQAKGAVPLIGVGGIFTAEDAWEKITAGASLLQIYSSLVYEGPQVTRTILTGLAERLAKEGMSHIRDAVGISS